MLTDIYKSLGPEARQTIIESVHEEKKNTGAANQKVFTMFIAVEKVYIVVISE
jgi:cyanophycinase-like exopeptidase